MNAPLTAPQQEHAYLSRLGERVRAWRTEHGMTRKALSLACGVSERYLAQLESGRGNISVLLLRKVARAMGVAVEHLVREEEGAARSGRIALIGLRGAGKSTLGEKLARSLGLPFVELDREVEKEAGAKLGEVFAMYGQDAFRRFERRALERVLNQNERAVIAAGGSLVTDPDTYKLLLDRCLCVWLRPLLKSTWRASSPRATCGPSRAARPRSTRSASSSPTASACTVAPTLPSIPPANPCARAWPKSEKPSDDQFRNASRALQPLEALFRGAGGDPHPGRRRGQGPGARVQAQAQQLRPRRRHRAARCAQPHPLRASRSEDGGDHERQEPHLLLRGEHLHARHQQPCVEGELLQVHQRDAQRHRGLERAFRPQVPRRAQRRHRGRRLRARARLRRDRDDRRPLLDRQPARGSPSGRTAWHGRINQISR